MLESKFQGYNIMATAIQENGMKGLTNGNINHVENGEICSNNKEMYQCDDNEGAEIDIFIRNVVCSFSVRCHLNLHEIALNGSNVVYKRENGMITMKLRRPQVTASIWSSGKITCTGAESEDDAKVAARKVARSLQKLGFKVRFNNFRVVNVLGTCLMPWSIRITSFSMHHKEAEYEPELHPGVTYKLPECKATLKIFSTGSITITAPSVAAVRIALEKIYPLVYEFRKTRSPEDEIALANRKRKSDKRQGKQTDTFFEEETVYLDEEDEGSDCSWD